MLFHFDLNRQYYFHPLHELQFDKYDTISLKAKDPKAVKITGNIISENSNGNSTVANS